MKVFHPLQIYPLGGNGKEKLKGINVKIYPFCHFEIDFAQLAFRYISRK